MIALVLVGLIAVQEPDIDALIRQLADESIEVREKAASALVTLGIRAEDGLNERLARSKGELHDRIKTILSTIAKDRALRAVLPPVRKVTIDAKEARLDTVFRELTEQSGMSFETDFSLDGQITVRVKDATPWEALDAVCRAANLSYGVDIRLAEPGGEGRSKDGIPVPVRGTPFVRIRPGGYPAVSRQFTRNYVVVPSRIEINRWTDFHGEGSSATLKLIVNWTPDTPPTSARIKLISAIDEKGRRLFVPEPLGRVRVNLRYEASKGNAWWLAAKTFDLTMPEADAKMIASVRGEAVMTYLIPTKTLTIETPDAPGLHVGTSEGLRVEVLDFKQEGEKITHRLSLSGNGGEANRIQGQADSHIYILRLRLEDGTIRDFRGQVLKNKEDLVIPCEWAGVKRKVAAIEVIVDWIMHSDKIEFELKDIPLPK